MPQETNDENEPIPQHSNLPSRFGFWGPMLIAFGCIVLCVPYKEKQILQARVAPEPRATLPKPTPVVIKLEEAPTNAPPIFPDVKINGFIYRPPSNAIVVSGCSYFQGDLIGTARVFSISADAMVLELNGYYKVVHIDPMLQPRRK